MIISGYAYVSFLFPICGAAGHLFVDDVQATNF